MGRDNLEHKGLAEIIGSRDKSLQKKRRSRGKQVEHPRFRTSSVASSSGVNNRRNLQTKTSTEKKELYKKGGDQTIGHKSLIKMLRRGVSEAVSRRDEMNKLVCYICKA